MGRARRGCGKLGRVGRQVKCRARLRLAFSSRAHGRKLLQLFRMVAAIGLLTAVAGVAATSAPGAEISGAGATFPYPIYAKWAEAYKKATGVAVSYQPVGS